MTLNNSELGKTASYTSNNTYNPGLLFPIPRQSKRLEIGIDDGKLPFIGMDIWNHYEVSWLDVKGKPEVAIAVIQIPASSPNIIESKSMKLYFNSFSNHTFSSKEELTEVIINDLSLKVKQTVKVELWDLNEINNFPITMPQGICIDNLAIEVVDYTVNPRLLITNSALTTTETLYSNLLKSNCLVTNQPDWATVIIEYSGKAINHASLLKYIISFRNHNEFHEQCVERIFVDIQNNCAPTELTVTARFTRRGGIDINPIRSTNKHLNLTNFRLIRQ
jgi:7-cyano-7-deazaguanine reductase